MAYNLSEREGWIYLAGLIDADGCICLSKKKDRVHYVTDFSFVNTSKELVEWVAKKVGGSARVMKQTNRPRNKKVYQVHLQGREHVKTVLGKLLPYLILKKRRAEIALEYHSLHKWRQGATLPLLPRAEELVRELKQLNRIGVM